MVETTPPLSGSFLMIGLSLVACLILGFGIYMILGMFENKEKKE